jgi:hypothetical protein
MPGISNKPRQPKALKCRACNGKFCTTKQADGSWHTDFPNEPPSADCKEHINSGLCRWEVNKLREQLWEKVAPFLKDRPVAFLTAVPPHRTVPFDKLGELRLQDEKRAIQRVLTKVLPKGTAAIAIFDISLDDDQTGEQRDRVWVPHFHILIIGIMPADLRKACRGLYKPTERVKRPVLIKLASTPKNALSYSLKHIGDVRADTAFLDTVGSGNRGFMRRWLKADERAILKELYDCNSLSDWVYMKGFRRPGGKA